MKTQSSLCAAVAVGILLLSSCSEQPSNPVGPAAATRHDTGRVTPAPPPTITLGTTKVKKQDFTKVLQSQSELLVSNRDNGGDASANFAPPLLFLGARDLDLSALMKISLSFNRGVYEAAYGSDRLRMIFYFAVPFGNYHAGDTITNHLFAIDSYVRNITVSWEGIRYDKGSLFDLINGSIRFDGLKPIVTIGAEKLLVSIEYSGLRMKHRPNGDVDSLRINIRADRVNVQEFADRFRADGFSFNVDSTTYTSRYLSRFAVIDTSHCIIRKPADRYLASGSIAGRIQQNGIWYFFRGTFSNEEGNTTAFFLKPDMAQLAGIVHHSPDLLSGVFTAAGGDTLSFRTP